MSHTPGPWGVKHQYNVFGITGGAEMCIAACGGGCDTMRDPEEQHQEMVANALLIAAAPELLAACEALVDWQDTPVSSAAASGMSLLEAIRLAREAIVRAKGA